MRNVQYFSFLSSDSDLDTTADDIKIEKNLCYLHIRIHLCTRY